MRTLTTITASLLVIGLFLNRGESAAAPPGPAAEPPAARLPAAPELFTIAPIKAWPAGPEWIQAVAFSPAGDRLAVGQKGEVQLLDTTTWELAAKIPFKGTIKSLAYAPNGGLLAIGGYQTVVLWDTAAASVARALPGHRGFVTSLAWSPDGQKILTGCDDEQARVFDLAAAGEPQRLTGIELPVNGVAWSPDGQWLATAAGDETRVTKAGQVALWAANCGCLEAEWTEHSKAAWNVAFTSDSRLLVSTGFDERAFVYDTKTRESTGYFGAHTRPTTAVVSLPGTALVATGSGGRFVDGNTIRIWEPASGQERAVIEFHGGRVTTLATTTDGRRLASGGLDKRLAVWDLAALVPAAAATANEPAGKAADEPGKAAASPARETVGPVAEPVPAVAPSGEAVALATEPAAAATDRPLKIGIIGLDTSHSPAFTQSLNGPEVRPEFAGCRITAAYPPGSADIPSSVSRIPEYTAKVQALGVEIVDSLPALIARVDAVLLETNDGRPHWEQVLPVLKAGKPVFIDKPIAASLEDTLAIFIAAEHLKVPVFSASALRFTPSTLAIRAGQLGPVTGCDAFSPASLEATHPDLYWYAIHGVETLFTVMGPGCVEVSRMQSPDFESVTGRWADGRIGTFRGIRRGGSGYGGTAFGEKGVQPLGNFAGYDPLLVEIIKFFRNGEPPVAAAETIEIYAFMSAADLSKQRGGGPINVVELIAATRPAAREKVAKALGIPVSDLKP